MKRAASRGLTLIELMVGLTILGMLLLAVMPSMTDWIRNSRVRNAAEAVQNGLQKARMEAMRRNTNVSFWLVSDSCALSSTSSSWVVSVDSPVGNCTAAPSTTDSPRIVEAHTTATGTSDVTVAAFAADGTTTANKVTFNGFGQLTDSAADIGRVNFSHATTAGTRRLRVTIGSGGAIRMCDIDAPAGDARVCP